MRPLTARVVILAAVLMLSLRAYGIGDKQFIVFSANGGGFTIVDGRGASVIVVDDEDWPGVVRAAGDLSLDIERVSGVDPLVLRDGKAPGQAYAIVIGTIGKSRLVDSLIEQHKLDVAEIRGKWESTVTQVVDHPFPNVDKALVIAGSDKRGTIFGIYELSEQMGVSPWYWWADVRIPHHDTISQWVELPGYGRTKSAMTTFPVTAASDTDSQAELVYPVHLYDTGVLRLRCILAATLNFVPGRGLRFAVSIDAGPRQIVDALEHNSDRDWIVAVRDNARTVDVPVAFARAGDHVIHIWYVDPGVVLEKLVLEQAQSSCHLPGAFGVVPRTIARIALMGAVF